MVDQGGLDRYGAVNVTNVAIRRDDMQEDDSAPTVPLVRVVAVPAPTVVPAPMDGPVPGPTPVVRPPVGAPPPTPKPRVTLKPPARGKPLDPPKPAPKAPTNKAAQVKPFVRTGVEWVAKPKPLNRSAPTIWGSAAIGLAPGARITLGRKPA